MGQLGIIVVYVVALGALMYFFAIKPQKKQQKEQQQLMDSMEIGDYVLTLKYRFLLYNCYIIIFYNIICKHCLLLCITIICVRTYCFN